MSHILVVDDNPNNLYLARFLLEHAGHEVDEASGGQQAIEATEKKTYNLILMDIQMPGMDGLTATRLIKEKKPGTRVVAVTARVMKNDRQSILDAGCDGYIEKPLDIDNFTKQIKAFL